MIVAKDLSSWVNLILISKKSTELIYCYKLRDWRNPHPNQGIKNYSKEMLLFTPQMNLDLD